MKKILLLIALLALSAAAWGQSDRVKTVETPDSASMVIFDTTGTNILGTDVQEAIEESNPLYPNHVWISETGGNNATGVLGDPHRAFADPWGAQDSLSGETNLSFLTFQGNYTYSGVGAGNALTRADTFTLFDISSSNYSMLNVTGSLTAPFITDRTGAANVSTAKTINIFAPASNFLFSDSGIATSWILGVYNPNTYATIRAKSLSNTDASGRAWGVQVASKFFRLEVDTMRTAAQIGLHVADDISTPAAIRLTRDIAMKVGFFYAGAGNTSDFRGLVRYQPALVTDSLTTIQIEIGAAQVQTTGLFAHFITTGRYVNSTASYYCKSYQTRGSANAGYMLSMSSPNAASFASGKVVFRVDEAQTHNGIFSTGSDSYPAGTNNLDASGNSRITIDLGQITTTSNFRGAIELQNITLSDSAQVLIHCDLCRFEGSAIPIRFTDCVFPEGTKFILSGTFFFNRPNELINITGTNDLTGLDISNAVFLNDGTAEWIEASTPTTISASGIWTNSSTTINVDVEGNELWGFSDCSGTFRPLQEILDAGCDTASSAELTIFFTDTPPDTIELTTSYTVVEWQAGSADGPAIALSATGDSLMLDEGIYEIHYNIQAIFFAATTDYYIQPAIRQGAGVLNKSIRTAYNIWGADETKATHIAATFRTEISADDTPIALVLAGDDNAAGGADVLIEKAILYVEKIE